MSPAPITPPSLSTTLSRPWFLILGPVLLVRWLNIVHYYFSEHSAAGPMNMIPVSLAFHTSVLVVLSLLFLWAIKSVKPRWATRLAVLFSIVVMTLGSVDFMVQHHLGSRFTPGLFKSYGLSSLLHREVYLNIFQYTAFSALNLAALISGIILLFFLKARIALSGKLFTVRELMALSLLAPGLLLPVLFDRHLQQSIVQPPELVWLREAASELVPADEANTPAHQKAFLELTGGKLKFSAPPNKAAGLKKPDLFILAIESLRAANLEFISGSSNTASTPNLTELSKQGVVFSRFIANGFPSTEGFLAINCSLWPHPIKRILVQLTDLQPDCLPTQLRQLGYHTKIFWGVNPDFDNQLSWARRWYEDLVYQVPGNILKHHLNMSDAALLQRVITRIKQHDASPNPSPVFAYVANAGTHVPFTLDGLFFDNAEQEKEAQEFNIDQTQAPNDRYNKTLALLDLQIGKFLKFLEDRGRPFILMILGDHSIPTTPEIGMEEKRLPSNDYLWTGALLVGPEERIGPPRTLSFPGSQVDILPTLLHLAGARAPYPGLGTDLLADVPTDSRRAVAIREGFLRLDRKGESLTVMRDDPSRFEIHPLTRDNSQADVSSPNPEETADTARKLHLASGYWEDLLNRRKHRPAN